MDLCLFAWYANFYIRNTTGGSALTRKLIILPINAVLLCIGLLDLATTVIWLHDGSVIEMNPVMAAFLKHGIFLFSAVKMFSLISYVSVMEWYRRNKSAKFAQMVGNITVAAYVLIYAVSFIGVNRSCLFG